MLEETKYIWLNGEFVPWAECKIHIITHSLHYGSGVFEGIRAYDVNGKPGILCLEEHIDRLFYSASVLHMEIKFSKEQLCEAVKELIRKNDVAHAYIRPLVYYGYGKMGVSPKDAPVDVAIACWPWGAYLPQDEIDVKTSKYVRISPYALVADAKVCGHYVNGILASLELKGTKYHEALLLDVNGNIAEGPGENFFIVKDGVLRTPQLGNILAGITRNTVIDIARSLDYEVKECDLTLDDAYSADEAFFTGTAAEMAPIRSIDDKPIGTGKMGPITKALKTEYTNLISGKSDKFAHLLTFP